MIRRFRIAASQRSLSMIKANLRYYLLAFGSVLLASNTSASPIHTMHEITADTGHWVGRLVLSSAGEGGYFTNEAGTDLGPLVDFSVDVNMPYVFGFGFKKGTDFNVSYVLTLYKSQSKENVGVGFSSKACQFNVSARSPANPDIHVISYNGATCHRDIVQGKGENFSVG